VSSTYKSAILTFFLFGAVTIGCKMSGGGISNQPANSNSGGTATAMPVKPNSDGTLPSGAGVEKEKPAPGKGNVQGKALYNQKPAAGVEVKLCEKFNRYFGGCSGSVFTAKTDSQGEYLIKNVLPGTYESLTVKVFESNYYVFATSGIVESAKYKIDPDQTFFAPDTNLFKDDLKLTGPKAGSKISPNNIEIKWEPYPDAEYYKFSIYADSSSGASTEYDYINKRIDGTSYVLDKPLSPGSYTCEVAAYNGNDTKLSQNSSDIKFTVVDAAAK